MVLILKSDPDKRKLDALIDQLSRQGFSINYSEGTETTVLGLVGDTSRVNVESLMANDIIARVMRVSEPYKLANRKFKSDDTVVEVGGARIGGGAFCAIAGPCSVESREQIIETAIRAKQSGAKLLRGGAFKPRTSPYSFRGLRADGIELLLEAKRETGLPIVTELTSINYIDYFADVDIIQVGARNMQNFDMLTELGKCDKPILLKRGLSSTIEELLMSAEYILSGGNGNVILCERGIRTFETATRNTLDISAVPVLKERTHLPVIVDPSHAAGLSSLIAPLAKASVVAGADGVMIEVHPSPKDALSDGAQSITPDDFDGIMQGIKVLCEFEGKTI